MQADARVLILEVDSGTVDLLALVLRASHPRASLLTIVDAMSFASALGETAPDLVMLSTELPWGTGPEIVAALRAAKWSCPIIAMVRPGAEVHAAQALRAGANDWILREESGYAAIPSTIENLVAARGDSSGAAQYRGLIDRSSVGRFRCTLEGALTDANTALLDRIGAVSVDDARGSNILELLLPAGHRAEIFQRLRRDGVASVPEAGIHLDLGQDETGWSIVTGLVEPSSTTDGAGEDRALLVHDLQAPLRTIAHLSQKVACAESEIERAALLADIAATTRRMGGQINTLLGKDETRPDGSEATCDANDALREALANLKSAVDGTQTHVTTDRLPTLRMSFGDVLQLLQNLIGNAIKFRSDVEPRVHISGEPRGERWLISVADNGIGIPEGASERIFAMFQRAHDDAGFPGSGIGLAICKRIVEGYGGRIWVDSEPGFGSTFNMLLPAAGPSLRPVEQDSSVQVARKTVPVKRHLSTS